MDTEQALQFDLALFFRHLLRLAVQLGAAQHALEFRRRLDSMAASKAASQVLLGTGASQRMNWMSRPKLSLDQARSAVRIGS
jgi:hypothetical protein